jgi:hypothetical protein
MIRSLIAELTFGGKVYVKIFGVKVDIPIDLMEATLSEETTSECVSELKCIERFLQKEESLAASLTAEIAA